MPAWTPSRPVVPVAIALLVVGAVLAPPLAAQQPRSDAGGSAPAEADKHRLMEQRARDLFPEYQRRKRADGKSSADAWLQATAADMGRRDGEASRRTQERQATAAQGSAQRPPAAAPAAEAARPKQGNERKCARTRVGQRMVPSMSGGSMQMIMVTECVPGT